MYVPGGGKGNTSISVALGHMGNRSGQSQKPASAVNTNKNMFIVVSSGASTTSKC